MTTSAESRYATLAIKLLLSEDEPTAEILADLHEAQWDRLLRLAQKNVILLRLNDRLTTLGLPIGPAFSEAARREEDRVSLTLELIKKTGEFCIEAGTEFLFTKAFQHYPDMGHDVDLFVMDRTSDVDELICRRLGALRAEGSLLNRIAGKTNLVINGSPSSLEIHHGRIGHFGEHNLFPDMLMINRVCARVDDLDTYVPSREDHLILHVIQRLYGHMYIRISDFVSSVGLIKDAGLNWDYVVRTTKKIGVFDGLLRYTGYISQIYNSVFGRDVVPPSAAELLCKGKQGPIIFKSSVYRFPIISVGGELYSKKLLAEIGRLNWESAGRLCLLPPVTALLVSQRLKRSVLGCFQPS